MIGYYLDHVIGYYPDHVIGYYPDHVIGHYSTHLLSADVVFWNSLTKVAGSVWGKYSKLSSSGITPVSVLRRLPQSMVWYAAANAAILLCGGCGYKAGYWWTFCGIFRRDTRLVELSE